MPKLNLFKGFGENKTPSAADVTNNLKVGAEACFATDAIPELFKAMGSDTDSLYIWQLGDLSSYNQLPIRKSDLFPGQPNLVPLIVAYPIKKGQKVSIEDGLTAYNLYCVYDVATGSVHMLTQIDGDGEAITNTTVLSVKVGRKDDIKGVSESTEEHQMALLELQQLWTFKCVSDQIKEHGQKTGDVKAGQFDWTDYANACGYSVERVESWASILNL